MKKFYCIFLFIFFLCVSESFSETWQKHEKGVVVFNSGTVSSYPAGMYFPLKDKYWSVTISSDDSFCEKINTEGVYYVPKNTKISMSYTREIGAMVRHGISGYLTINGSINNSNSIEITEEITIEYYIHRWYHPYFELGIVEASTLGTDEKKVSVTFKVDDDKPIVNVKAPMGWMQKNDNSNIISIVTSDTTLDNIEIFPKDVVKSIGNDNYEVIKQGQNILNVIAYDAFGRTNDNQSIELKYDSENPEISFKELLDENKWFQENQYIYIDAYDDISGINKDYTYCKQYCANGIVNEIFPKSIKGETDTKKEIQFEISDEGDNYCEVYVYDNAKNITTISKKVKIDKSYPIIKFINLETEWYSEKNEKQVSINIEDSVSGINAVYFEIDGKETTISEKDGATDYKRVYDYSFKEDGIHSIYVKVTDKSGRTSENTKLLNKDSTEPSIKIINAESDKEWYKGNVSFDIETEDIVSGIDTVTINHYVDGVINTDSKVYELKTVSIENNTSRNVTIKQRQSVTLKTNGVHRIVVSAKDKAGNTTEEKVYTVKIDESIPAKFTCIAEYDSDIQKYRDRYITDNKNTDISFNGNVQSLLFAITEDVKTYSENNKTIECVSEISKVEVAENIETKKWTSAVLISTTSKEINKTKIQKTYVYRYLVESLPENLGQEFVVKTTDVAGNESSTVITLNIDRSISQPDVNQIIIKNGSIQNSNEKIDFLTKQNKIVELTKIANTDTNLINVYNNDKDVGNFDKAIKKYPTSDTEIQLEDLTEKNAGLYKLIVENIDENGNHADRKMYIAYRDKMDTPVVQQGYELKNGNLKTYIEVEKGNTSSSLDSVTVNFTKDYYYFGVQKLESEKYVSKTAVKSIKEDNGKYRIYIDDIKNEIKDWGSDKDGDRTLGVFCDVYYAGTSPDIKSETAQSNLRKLVVYDTAPVFNKTISAPEYAGKNITLSFGNDNGFTKFAADPDEDTLVYKVILSDRVSTVKTYYTHEIPASIELVDQKYQKGLVITIEAKGLRKKDLSRDEITEKIIKTAWNAEPTTAVSRKEFTYVADKVDLNAPEITSDELDYWNSSTVWTNKEKSGFTIKDNESGINTINIRYYEIRDDNDVQVFEESLKGNKAKSVAYNADFSKVGEDLTGKFYISFDITDVAGNTITERMFGPVLLDTKEPVINEAVTTNDNDGDVALQITADDGNGSGITKYCWKTRGSDEWSAWQAYSSTVYIALSNYLPDREILLKVRDRALNESSIKTIVCQEYEVVPEITEFTIEGVNENGYVTELSNLLPVVRFKDGSTLEKYICTWKLTQKEKEGFSFNGFEELKYQLQEGVNNHVQLTVSNSYGNTRTAECDTDFIIDVTPPNEMEVNIVGTPYKGIPVEVYINGGLDNSCNVARYVSLVDRSDRDNERILCTEKVESNGAEGTVRLSVAMYESEIINGNTYITAESVNAAGLIRKSNNSIRLTLQESTGLTVIAREYTSGDINVSWTTSVNGITEYEYQLSSVSGKVIKSDRTDKTFAVISLDEEETTETVFYVSVKGYKESSVAAEGTSGSITYSREYPDSEWTELPVAALSKNVWAKYSVGYSHVPVTEINWTYEIYEYNEEEKEWQWNGRDEWKKVTVPSGRVSVDLSREKAEKIIGDGSLVRFILTGENKAGLESQVITRGIIIDDTAPPVPVIMDQGDVINQVKETTLKADWSTSLADPESGSTYYWRWYLSGEYRRSGDWVLADKDVDEISQIMKAGITEIKEQKYDGCILYFEVKAVNGAGTESVGRSNGILLDSNAPLIDDVRMYTDSSRTAASEISGYTNISKIREDLYIGIDASDTTSWVANATGFLYNKLDNGDEEKAGSCTFEIEEDHVISQIKLSDIAEGRRFFVQAQAEDAAGNRTGSAISDCVLVIGDLAEISQVTLQGDTKRLNANWGADGETIWVKYYAVKYSYELEGKPYSYKKYSTVNSYSVTWKEIGLDINGSLPEVVYVNVTPVGYDYTPGNTVRSELEIDLTVPTVAEQRIPFEERLIAWADMITGYTSYQSGRTGTSLVEWASLYAEDGALLSDWVKKLNTPSITVTKDIHEFIPGKEDSFWQNKYLMLKFRAINGMGLSSPEKICTPVMIDLTPADILSISRNWGWTNAVNEINSIDLTAGDRDTGIISCMTGLVRRDDVIKNGIENVLQSQSIEIIEPMIPAAELLVQNNRTIVIDEHGEDVYVAVVGARNGSGLWTYAQSSEIVIDRTPPVMEDEDFKGVFKRTEISDEGEIETYIFNGPQLNYNVKANELAKWKVKLGTDYVDGLAVNTYEDTVENEMSFLGEEEGKIYVIVFEMTDRAGNTGYETKYMRYNKAPSINIKYDSETENKIIVWPGHSKTISELFEVFENEELSEGDYPYKFEWNGGNETSLSWTGGAGNSSVFVPNAGFATKYYQDGKAQVTDYNAVLKVTDCYGKESVAQFVITVENTKKGELLVDEYWTGSHRIIGEVTVPKGKKLTLENILVDVDGKESGIMVESGFNISGQLEGLGNVEIQAMNPLLNWKGIMVDGNINATKMNISGAQRAFTLVAPGKLQIDNLYITNCITGLHLFGGTFATKDLDISYCKQYGIKIESEGNYVFGNLNYNKNGKNIYLNGITK